LVVLLPEGRRVYDVVVLGGGLAGLTAGLFAARHGLATLVVEAAVPGGHLINVEKIEDFPGFPEGVAGYDLGPLVQEQAANHGAEFQLAEVRSLEWQDPYWLVDTSDGAHRAKAVIVALGSRRKELGLAGEARFEGKGVSHCATCDGPLFRNRVVAVIGGGDSGLQEALTLAEYAASVILLVREATPGAQQVYQQRVAGQPKIQVKTGRIVEEICGVDAVTGVRIRDATTGEEETIEVAGLFVYAGLAPNTQFLRGVVPLDAAGHIPTDINLRTERPGLFAAGDIRQGSARQAVSSAGDGATAAIAAYQYVRARVWTYS
jgi:thioredoxin reductase (NADPH)